jgi:3-oxoacyl-[acyl-carrier-protein] synthase-3
VSASRIVSWGSALPEKVVTNADLSAYLDTSDEWIVERTGIRERRVGGTTSSLAIDAAQAALERIGRRGSDVDMLLLSTTTPEQTVPATSATVSAALGTGGGAMDLNAACAGFVYGLVVGDGMIASGAKRVLLIGSDTLSTITDWDDRSTAVLFADGAGAVVLEPDPDGGALLAWDLGVDGTAQPLLYCDHGSTMRMDGREVFRRAVRAVVQSAEIVLERAGVRPEEIAVCIPHQANIRILEAANARLGIPMDRTVVVLDRTGNTSSGSVPLALAAAADDGRLHPGDLVLFSGFGAGMTWASALVRWTVGTA